MRRWLPLLLCTFCGTHCGAQYLGSAMMEDAVVRPPSSMRTAPQDAPPQGPAGKRLGARTVEDFDDKNAKDMLGGWDGDGGEAERPSPLMARAMAMREEIRAKRSGRVAGQPAFPGGPGSDGGSVSTEAPLPEEQAHAHAHHRRLAEADGRVEGDAPPPPPRTAAMADLQSFLEGVRLAQYYNALTGLGVSTPADVSDLEDADLVGIGMKKIEINRLMRGFLTPVSAALSEETESETEELVVPRRRQASVPRVSPAGKRGARAGNLTRRPAAARPGAAGGSTRQRVDPRTIGPNAEAYRVFCELDEDGSGGLDLGELTNIYAKMRLPELSKRKLASLFADLEKTEFVDGSVVRLGYVTFEAFAGYYNATQERERRLATRRVKEIFQAVQPRRTLDLLRPTPTAS